MGLERGPGRWRGYGLQPPPGRRQRHHTGFESAQSKHTACHGRRAHSAAWSTQGRGRRRQPYYLNCPVIVRRQPTTPLPPNGRRQQGGARDCPLTKSFSLRTEALSAMDSRRVLRFVRTRTVMDVIAGDSSASQAVNSLLPWLPNLPYILQSCTSRNKHYAWLKEVSSTCCSLWLCACSARRYVLSNCMCHYTPGLRGQKE